MSSGVALACASVAASCLTPMPCGRLAVDVVQHLEVIAHESDRHRQDVAYPLRRARLEVAHDVRRATAACVTRVCQAKRQFRAPPVRHRFGAARSASYGSSHALIRTGRLWALKRTHVSSRCPGNPEALPNAACYEGDERGFEMPALDEREIYLASSLAIALDVLSIAADAHAEVVRASTIATTRRNPSAAMRGMTSPMNGCQCFIAT